MTGLFARATFNLIVLVGFAALGILAANASHFSPQHPDPRIHTEARRVKWMHLDPRGLTDILTTPRKLKVVPAHGMPADVEYVDCGYDPEYCSLFLILGSREWPEVPAGSMPGRVDGPLLLDVTTGGDVSWWEEPRDR